MRLCLKKTYLISISVYHTGLACAKGVSDKLSQRGHIPKLGLIRACLVSREKALQTHAHSKQQSGVRKDAWGDAKQCVLARVRRVHRRLVCVPAEGEDTAEGGRSSDGRCRSRTFMHLCGTHQRIISQGGIVVHVDVKK